MSVRTGPDGGSRRARLTTGWRFGGPVPLPGTEDRLDPAVVAAWSAPDLDDASWPEVTVPHTVVPLSWELWDAATWEKVWVYRRPLDTGRRPPGERVFLDFDGAVTAATVVLDGTALGTHRGGYLPFSHEITALVDDGVPHQLTVVLDCRFGINVPPNAPDPVSSSAIDFHQPGGIDRDVWLRHEPAVFVGDLGITHHDVMDPVSRRTSVVVTLDAADPGDGAGPAVGAGTLTARLLDATGAPLSTTAEHVRVGPGRSDHTLQLTGLDGVRLWDVDDPVLYDLEVTLCLDSVGTDGTAPHSVSRRTGYREARFALDGFFLNGRRRYLMGVNRHGYFPFAGFAMPDRVHRRDAEIIRTDLNCVMVRCSHYPQTASFLDACDELGLLVWEESPGWHYVGDAEWQSTALDQMTGMIARDRHRPSVVVWGARLNETPDRPEFYARTEALVKQLDPDRATSGAMCGDHSRAATFQHDVFAYDDYTTALVDGDRRPALVPPVTDRPYLVSESVAARSSPTSHYRRTESAVVAQHQAVDHAIAHETARSTPGHTGLLVWLAFDYQSPRGNGRRGVRYTGVADVFREPKPGAAIYRSQVPPATRVVIEPAFAWDPPEFGGAHGYAGRPENAAWGPGSEAVICSNCDRLEVFLGDERVASVSPDRARFGHLEFPPSFVDLTLTGHTPELRIDGFVGGEVVGTRRWSGDRAGDSLTVRTDDDRLDADGADGTRVVVSVVDRHGNPRATAPHRVTVQVDGPAVLIGERVLDLDRTGAVAAVWLRTVHDTPGTVVVRVSAPGMGSDAVTIGTTRR